MWEVVDYAEGKGPPPQVLIRALECRQWGLPEIHGGRGDQPAGLLSRMTYALNVYDNWSAYLHAESQGRGVQFKREASPRLSDWLQAIFEGKLTRDSG